MNAIESQIAPNEAEVAGYERQIQILMKSSDTERNRIANDRLKLTEVEADIKNLENRLRELRETRGNIQDSIAKSENIIKDNERRIDDAREKIKHLEDEIRRLRDKVDSLRAECVNLEIQVERLRTDIAVAEAKEDRINDQIDELNRRINIEERKLDEEELRDIRGMIDALNKALPNIVREIDRQYYYCYGEGAVTVEETGDVVVYIVRGESFGNYLLSVYGQSVKADHLSKTQYRLHRHDIFSPVWIAKFGYPMVTDAFDSLDFSFNGDFTCLQPSRATSGYGRIKEVRGNRMVVDKDGHDEVLHFGACSRLEGTKHLPEVGQNIAFKGVPSRAGGYNIYGATCW